MGFGAVEGGKEGLDSFLVGVLGAGEMCSDLPIQGEGQNKGQGDEKGFLRGEPGSVYAVVDVVVSPIIRSFNLFL